uniref:Mpv17-like protein 2 n=1 Tax=Dicentrarchus labrax TaxID=13489 RepID=A0A8P4GIB6_DICLA
MLQKVGKRFLVRARFTWRSLFDDQFLLVTNTLTGGSLLAMGDVVQQSWEIHKEQSKVLDWKRIGYTFVMGCSTGPLLHHWYGRLDSAYAGRAMNTVVKKVLADQLIISPIIGIWYFIGMGLMEGDTLAEGWKDFKGKFWEYYKADCCVWPPVQMFNFYYVSPKYRVMYINVISLGWDVFLSYLKHRVSQPHRRLKRHFASRIVLLIV